MHVWLKLARFIDSLHQRVGQVLYWLSLIMILFGVYNATVRYLGVYIGRNLSSNAYIDAQWYLFGIMFMLGAGYTLRHNGHVRVDVIYGRLGEKTKAWIEVLGTALFLLPFCIAALWFSLDWVELSWRVREGSPNPGGLARYPLKAVIPIGFMLLFLQGVSHLIKAVAFLTGHRERLFDLAAGVEEKRI